MLAVHFGAGNIGRGFIGQLLYHSDYEVCFVDVNEKVIDELNHRNGYTILLADDSQEEISISNVRGVNSLKHPEEVVELIIKADIITTAVGPTVLNRIAELLAKGIRERIYKNPRPLNIIACENMIGGGDYLQQEVCKHLTADEQEQFLPYIGFPNAAVDRIVPVQNHEDPLLVTVEPFYEWVVDCSGVKGKIPLIKGVTFVDNLLPYIKRKLFTVNTGHAITAYLGHYYGLSTIEDAIINPKVRSIVEGALFETGQLLIQKYHFDIEEHGRYINKILKRFENHYISDDIDRVARSPIRKLGTNDRFVKPVRELMELGIKPNYLITGIAAVLLYRNDEDPEAVELRNLIFNQSIEEALEKYSEISVNESLTASILEKYYELKNVTEKALL
ncbi:mannitol-1-phosphate 5-dehydrogenase [Ectobacillus panaciterrae]|uniref:mannitol-1-phosphate 5-dehydrogenase n=1 Tax=Ectobacillus panaciterrae TaxID=363872 RepID=UPI000429B360|nr:mannitol-1-phosphate 5-dehydrogenase [Ectobacillus panaciterrae]